MVNYLLRFTVASTLDCLWQRSSAMIPWNYSLLKEVDKAEDEGSAESEWLLRSITSLWCSTSNATALMAFVASHRCDRNARLMRNNELSALCNRHPGVNEKDIAFFMNVKENMCKRWVLTFSNNRRAAYRKAWFAYTTICEWGYNYVQKLRSPLYDKIREHPRLPIFSSQGSENTWASFWHFGAKKCAHFRSSFQRRFMKDIEISWYKCKFIHNMKWEILYTIANPMDSFKSFSSIHFPYPGAFPILFFKYRLPFILPYRSFIETKREIK